MRYRIREVYVAGRRRLLGERKEYLTSSWDAIFWADSHGEALDMLDAIKRPSKVIHEEGSN